jgi:hypothetical protein
MKIGQTLLALVTGTALCQAQDSTTDTPTLPDPDAFHLFLLIGQSNMAGRGELDPAQTIDNSRILVLDAEGHWQPAAEPLHFDKPKIAGAGLAMSFARSYADTHPHVTVGLIPCAVGGTPLSRWQRDGDLYAMALQRARLAKGSGTLIAALWHQGESDTSSPTTTASYGQRLQQMIAHLRQDLESPALYFIAGHLSHFATDPGKQSRHDQINDQIDAAAKSMPHMAVAPSDGLGHKGDDVHFDAASLRKFGIRYADALQALISQKVADE